MELKFGAKEWFVFIILLLLADLAIFLNIPFLRQILGFLFLTILPGLLILQILKLNKIGFLEKFILTWGLSISFLMFFGLLINNLSLSLGYDTPLATIPLLIFFNIAFIVLAIIGHSINKNLIKTSEELHLSVLPKFSTKNCFGGKVLKNWLPNFNLSTSEKAFLIVPILFPAVSILGTHLMKTADNNIILMFLLFLIPIYIAFVCFFNQKFPKRLYPVVIFSISLSLLLIFMLRFPHICGHDVHTEYYFFHKTLDNHHWSILSTYLALDACLSISLLPTIFQSILNVDAQEYLFKGVCVSICCVGPLAIYVISKKYVEEGYAFLASFFFMSQYSFLVAAGSPRTNLAIFFVALAVMVFFNDKINPVKRRILVIIFILSVVVSHYSTTYIFFFILLGTFVGVEILLKKYTFEKVISLTLVVLFFAFIFFWYSQVTESSFNEGVRFVENTFVNLNNFFIEESRAPEFQQLAGQGLKYPMLSRVSLAFTWGAFIFIGIGVLTMIKRYREMVSISNLKQKKTDFLKTKFEMEYLVMTLTCLGLLVIVIALPHISTKYGIKRVYSLVLIILSVCFVIGGMTLSKHFFFFTKHFLSKERTCAKKDCNSFGKAFLSKKRFVLKEKQKSLIKNTSEVQAYLIILLILLPYFLFATGAIHQICGVHGEMTLNSEGENFEREYVYDQESYASKWVKNYYIEKNNRLYTADYFGKRKLMSQGKFSRHSVDHRSFSNHNIYLQGYFYLSYDNVVNGKFALGNMSDYMDIFIEKSKIYDSRGSEVYKI